MLNQKFITAVENIVMLDEFDQSQVVNKLLFIPRQLSWRIISAASLENDKAKPMKDELDEDQKLQLRNLAYVERVIAGSHADEGAKLHPIINTFQFLSGNADEGEVEAQATRELMIGISGGRIPSPETPAQMKALIKAEVERIEERKLKMLDLAAHASAHYEALVDAEFDNPVDEVENKGLSDDIKDQLDIKLEEAVIACINRAIDVKERYPTSMTVARRSDASLARLQAWCESTRRIAFGKVLDERQAKRDEFWQLMKQAAS